LHREMSNNHVRPIAQPRRWVEITHQHH
jgi:hypothetical protein